MAESILRIIPTDPAFVPDPDAARAACAQLFARMPGAKSVSAYETDDVAFIDCGENFERVVCPKCLGELPRPWWQAAMDRAKEAAYADLAVTTPCCDFATSLNDLGYHWPQGFAKFVFEAVEPPAPGVPPDLLTEMARIVGVGLRVVRARY